MSAGTFAGRRAGKTFASALDFLIGYAEGRLFHLNEGICPDHIQGHETRDPDCGVCQALNIVTGAPGRHAGPGLAVAAPVSVPDPRTPHEKAGPRQFLPPVEAFYQALRMAQTEALRTSDPKREGDALFDASLQQAAEILRGCYERALEAHGAREKVEIALRAARVEGGAA